MKLSGEGRPHAVGHVQDKCCNSRGNGWVGRTKSRWNTSAECMWASPCKICARNAGITFKTKDHVSSFEQCSKPLEIDRALEVSGGNGAHLVENPSSVGHIVARL